MTALLLTMLLAVSLDAGSPSALTATPGDTWSQFGYLQLRWGMGPADAEAALRAGAEMKSATALRLARAGQLSEYEADLQSFKILDYEVKTAKLSFVDGALYRVQFEPTLKPTPSAWLDWFKAMLHPMMAKYGKPATDKLEKTMVFFSWVVDGDRIVVSGFPGYASIEHQGPLLAARAFRVRQSLDTEAKKL